MRVFRGRGVTTKPTGPISIYELGGSALDSGPAEVHFIQEIGVLAIEDSMVAGDPSGASSYNDGSAYLILPFGAQAHDLSALTISFYYQRNDDASKHVVMAAGANSGAQAGDFSIEVQPDGLLRAWHVGQDLALRFFGGFPGIAGTNLQVDTAYRVDLSLGPEGAKIYLDGTEVSTIDENTNGWNNARSKYLLRWTDGLQAPAIGALDLVRIWPRQLSASEIAALADAVSITIGEAPPPSGEEPLVPSTAEFLLSDEAAPTATFFVSNQNRGNGSGSSAANAKELNAALAAASSPDNLIAVCQTPGVIEHWDYPNGLNIPAGVTLQARQGDGVVISRCVEFAAFQTESSGQGTVWELFDAAKKIWRSVATFSPTNSRMHGFWHEFDHSHFLVPYQSLTQVQAPYSNGEPPDVYECPGMYLHTDGRVYIRMQKPHPVKNGVGSPWRPKVIPFGHTNPECVSTTSATEGVLNYPVTEDPRDYKIFLSRDNVVPAFTTNAGCKIGAGINSIGYRRTVQQVTGPLIGGRGLHHGWREFAGPTQVLTNVFWERGRFTRGSCRHLGRSPFKFNGWLTGLRGAFIEHVQNGTSNNLYFINCTIHGWHEIMVGPGTTDNRYRFKFCTMFDIVDDGFQQRPSVARVEIGYCYFLASALGGNTSGGSTPSAGQGYGQFYVHHNIFDARTIFLAGAGENHTPCKLWLNHSAGLPQPRKNYNNTILWGPDVENQQTTPLYCQREIPSGIPHENFNNIIVRMDDRRYAIGGQSINQPDDSAQSVIRRTAASNEMWDWNCYWRDIPNLVRGLMVTTEISTGGTNYATLAAFKAANPGFETNGVEAEPQMGAVTDWTNSTRSYRPTSANMSANATSLSGANWWSTPPTWGDVSGTIPGFDWSGLQPSAWKGALDPAGDTMPIGVQNP